MKTISKLILILSIITLISCEETVEPAIHESDKLIGTWINGTPLDTLCRYERVDTLNICGYGFSIKSDHSFVERKNVGWCGTPPVTYGNFEGSWSKNDSIININVGYWGGTVDYQWKVISVDDHYLIIDKVKEELHKNY